MSGVYSLKTTVKITFVLPKLDLKKSIKKQSNFPNSKSFALCEQLSNFLLSYSMKTFYCLLSRILDSLALKHSCYYKSTSKSVLLSIITYHDLSYPKVLYKSVLLSGKNVALRKLTPLIIPKSLF